MSAPSPAPLRRAKKYFDEAAFRALHEAVGKLDFTPDFNPSIEAILAMPDVAFAEKLLALVKLQAWGNQSLFAVRDGARNSPFTEADCARQFGVGRQTINRNAQKLVARYQLRIEGGRLYPVIDPEAEKSKVVTHGADTPSPNLRLLKQRWFAEHPEIHEQYQKAFQFIDTINRQIAADLRAQVSTPVVTTASEAPDQRGGHENGNGADTPPTPLRTTETPILIEKKEELKKEELSPPTPSLEDDAPSFGALLVAADLAGSRYAEGQLPRLSETWESLSPEERKAARDGLRIRKEIGEYAEPRFVPWLTRYLIDKLWTARLTPAAQPRRKGPDTSYLDALIASGGEGHGH